MRNALYFGMVVSEGSENLRVRHILQDFGRRSLFRRRVDLDLPAALLFAALKDSPILYHRILLLS